MPDLRIDPVDQDAYNAFLLAAQADGRSPETAIRDFKIARATLAAAFPGRQKPKTYEAIRQAAFKAARRAAYGS